MSLPASSSSSFPQERAATALRPHSRATLFTLPSQRDRTVAVNQVWRTCGKSGPVAANCSAAICKNWKSEGHQQRTASRLTAVTWVAGQPTSSPKRCLTYAEETKTKEGQADRTVSVTTAKESRKPPPTKADSEQSGPKEGRERERQEGKE